MRRLWPWALAVVLLGGALVAYDFLLVMTWVGGYNVVVAVQRTGSRPIASAEAAAMFREWWEAAGHDPSRIAARWHVVTLQEGGSFTLWVRSSGAVSGWGRQLSYAREEVLVVKVAYANGHTGVATADLPDSHAIVLQVP
jgi:hypothetical protein